MPVAVAALTAVALVIGLNGMNHVLCCHLVAAWSHPWTPYLVAETSEAGVEVAWEEEESLPLTPPSTSLVLALALASISPALQGIITVAHAPTLWLRALLSPQPSSFDP